MKCRPRYGLATLLMALGCLGCSALLDNALPIECSTDDDCPMAEFCHAGECTLDQRMDQSVIPDLETLDATLSDGSLDAGSQMDVHLDMESISDTQVTTDMMVIQPAPFEDGLCFDGQSGTVHRPDPPSNFIPSALCSSWAKGWVDKVDSRITLNLDRGPSNLSMALDVAGEPTIQGHQLAVALNSSIEAGVNIWTFDLRDDTGAFNENGDASRSEFVPNWESLGVYISPSSYHQSNPQWGDDFIAYEERGPDTTGRVHVIQNELKTDCGRDGHHQWGLVSGDGWIAFFEQKTDTLRPRLTIVPSDDCANPARRRQRLLTHPVTPHQNLKRVSDELFWLESPLMGTNLLRRWNHRGRTQEPVTEMAWLGDESPIEIDTSSNAIALVTFRPTAPRFALYLIDMNTGDRRLVNTSRDVRQPRISDQYLFWTEGSGQTGWEVRYESLEN